jgi:hypothetical protein
LQLLGDALGDSNMRDWGRAAMAAEVRRTCIIHIIIL